MIEEFMSKFFESNGSQQVALLNSIQDSKAFANELTKKILQEPNLELIQLLTASLTLHSNKFLYSELSEYFGLPLFKQLSEARLQFEIRKNDRIQKVEFNENASPEFLEKSSFLPGLIEVIFEQVKLYPYFLNLIMVILLQPSLRRFVKPYFEDSLTLYQFQFANIPELVRIWNYPINEFSGVYFANTEAHFQSRFTFIQEFHANLLRSGRCLELAKLSTIELTSCTSHLENLTEDDLKFVLKMLNCDNYPETIPRQTLIQAIASLLYCPLLETPEQVFDPFETRPVLPLTAESLSVNDLMDRHYRLLQAKFSSILQEILIDNLSNCKPVLNRLGKTEFGSWTRNASEIMSVAVVGRGAPGLSDSNSTIVEVSISTLPFDDCTINSWKSLQVGDSIVVASIVADAGGFKINLAKHTWFKKLISSKNMLTLTLELDSRNHENSKILNSANFLIKVTGTEAKKLQLLHSFHLVLQSKGGQFPEIISDYLLGIEDESQSLLQLDNESFFKVPACLTESQSLAFKSVLDSRLSITYGPFASGVTSVLIQCASKLSFANEKTLIIVKSESSLERIYSELVSCGMKERYLARLGNSLDCAKLSADYVNLLKQAIELVNTKICLPLGLSEVETCNDCDYLWKVIIQPRWKTFSVLMDSSAAMKDLQSSYPFITCKGIEMDSFEGHFRGITDLFNNIRELSAIEHLKSSGAIATFVLSSVSKVILITSAYASTHHHSLSKMNIGFDNFFVDDAHFIPESESLLHLLLQKDSRRLKRLSLFGHAILSSDLTLFQRFLAYGFAKAIVFPSKPRNDSKVQFVNVAQTLGAGEEEPRRHYYQNLDEAEYAVAFYQIMRLSGTAAKDIAIIASSQGQIDLIHEILATRCYWTQFFGKPKFVGTISESCGTFFKHVIISLVRTNLLGYLQDPAWLDMALSRSLETATILGNYELFSKHHVSYFSDLANQSRYLKLPDGKSFENVEQLCAYAYEMSQSIAN